MAPHFGTDGMTATSTRVMPFHLTAMLTSQCPHPLSCKQTLKPSTWAAWLEVTQGLHRAVHQVHDGSCLLFCICSKQARGRRAARQLLCAMWATCPHQSWAEALAHSAKLAACLDPPHRPTYLPTCLYLAVSHHCWAVPAVRLSWHAAL